jgi:hypothetical protein
MKVILIILVLLNNFAYAEPTYVVDVIDTLVAENLEKTNSFNLKQEYPLLEFLKNKKVILVSRFPSYKLDIPIFIQKTGLNPIAYQQVTFIEYITKTGLYGLEEFLKDILATTTNVIFIGNTNKYSAPFFCKLSDRVYIREINPIFNIIKGLDKKEFLFKDSFRSCGKYFIQERRVFPEIELEADLTPQEENFFDIYKKYQPNMTRKMANFLFKKLILKYKH